MMLLELPTLTGKTEHPISFSLDDIVSVAPHVKLDRAQEHDGFFGTMITMRYTPPIWVTTPYADVMDWLHALAAGQSLEQWRAGDGDPDPRVNPDGSFSLVDYE